ncbi:hypothetical protein CEXT_105431 [Caerostris extrusa]|uniref:Uncharacterized protein n=1 Tax=Caerostris extrusa TaxID=172846 RepID=A0AAV4NRH2_CAEEX|nr:hypothetical protein CEXT_105431 [Caerostris extrusa]
MSYENISMEIKEFRVIIDHYLDIAEGVYNSSSLIHNKKKQKISKIDEHSFLFLMGIPEINSIPCLPLAGSCSNNASTWKRMFRNRLECPIFICRQ